METFNYDPEIPAKPPTAAFVQTIALQSDGKAVGVIRWHSPADAEAGLVQILDITVSVGLRRAGKGRKLLEAAIGQARELHRRRKSHVRRVWISVEQKAQVIGRAFLTSGGFHHVGTVNGLYLDQDLMIYVKSLD